MLGRYGETKRLCLSYSAKSDLTRRLHMSKKGTVVAAMVAGLFASAAPFIPTAKAEGKVKCAGANACKAQGECGGKDHGCSGKNECKGKGWITTADAKECSAKGGKVVKSK
jgi:hypothetical protein